MMILPYLLFGFFCALIVIVSVIVVSCIMSMSSKLKEQEDEEQMKWLTEYQERNLAVCINREKGT